MFDATCNALGCLDLKVLNVGLKLLVGSFCHLPYFLNQVPNIVLYNSFGLNHQLYANCYIVFFAWRLSNLYFSINNLVQEERTQVIALHFRKQLWHINKKVWYFVRQIVSLKAPDVLLGEPKFFFDYIFHAAVQQVFPILCCFWLRNDLNWWTRVHPIKNLLISV